MLVNEFMKKLPIKSYRAANDDSRLIKKQMRNNSIMEGICYLKDSYSWSRPMILSTVTTQYDAPQVIRR